MPIGDYRVRIIAVEPAADGNLHWDVFVERQLTNPPDETWGEIPNGHRTLVTTAAEFQAIVDGLGNDQAKREQIEALLKQKVRDWGVDASDMAEQGLAGLLTFPLFYDL